ncbi:TRAP transporter small permease [Oceanicola sp. S124]|uniref:TRAP transporter small permease n=1 Tax=Oceanicola sp. S124 TaxID=1042378 RepID=UPI0002557E6B|nr:TRAP transporter small permease [Oceanicola sp. S124]
MTRATTLIGWLVKAGGVIGVACIIALTLLTVATVAARALNIAFPGSYALSEILLIPAISFSLCYAAWSGAHTRVEFVTSLLPPRVSQVLEGVIDLIALVFWVAICRAVWLEAIKMTARNETAAIINVPAWPFRWMMVAALVLTCIVLVMRACLSFAGRPTEDERSH